ncbi:MAG: SMC-Scp complex subunit ScpB [Candidatus Taylorbacteria bacterium]|nr:SMC-Scp complex subunit ScpB [Candidatus Taylorbacteria bacterium]
MTLDVKIEAVLFWKAEPVALARLGKIFGENEAAIKKALLTLEEKLRDRGLALIFKDDEVSLRTAPAVSGLIETLTKEELARDLGKAGLETLSIILYQGPLSRREIDYVRGVNSTFILRHLLVRGLAERIENPKDKRLFLYRPTFDLLSFLGISRLEDLPEYGSVRREIETSFAQARKEGEHPGEQEHKAPPELA